MADCNDTEVRIKIVVVKDNFYSSFREISSRALLYRIPLKIFPFVMTPCGALQIETNRTNRREEEAKITRGLGAG